MKRQRRIRKEIRGDGDDINFAAEVNVVATQRGRASGDQRTGIVQRTGAASPVRKVRHEDTGRTPMGELIETPGGLTQDELAGEAAAEELPDREQMSLVNANIAAPVNAAVAANVLSDDAIAPRRPRTPRSTRTTEPSRSPEKVGTHVR